MSEKFLIKVFISCHLSSINDATDPLLGHVLITTYAGLKSYGDLLLNEEWEYAILDEGHKIRNPNAEISLSCKNSR